MKVELNIKTVAVIIGVLSAIVGNVFLAGNVWQQQEIHMSKMSALEEKVNNYLDVKQDILELNYKIKGLKLLVDPEYREMCQKNMNDIKCK